MRVLRWSESRRADSNRRPAVYETAALPLSHAGLTLFNLQNLSRRLKITRNQAAEINPFR